MPPLVIAHRTCPRHAPENSLAGIEKARELGADVVEIDVRRARDGTPMLLHDKWLLRTTGRPWRLDWISGDRAARTPLRGGGTIPTLAQALAALGPNLKVAIDVKDPGAGPAVVAEIRNQGIERQVMFWSQHDAALTVAARDAADLELSLLRDTRTAAELDRLLADATRLRVQGISAHWSQVGPDLARRCHDASLRLYAWCKTEAIDAEKVALLDGLVTDWPEAGRAAATSD